MGDGGEAQEGEVELTIRPIHYSYSLGNSTALHRKIHSLVGGFLLICIFRV